MAFSSAYVADCCIWSQSNGNSGFVAIELGGGVLDPSDVNGNDLPDACEDLDGDGVRGTVDNCLAHANPDQRDTDGDGYGNLCDADLDGDGTVNFADLSRFRQAFLTTDPHADLDGSGRVDFADLARFRALFLQPPGPSADAP